MSDVSVDADSAGRQAAGRPGTPARPAGPDLLTELLVRAVDGETTAFEQLYDQTSAHVYGVAMRVLHDGGLAEKTTQQVYQEVWATAGRFVAAQESPLAWLTALVHRIAVDDVRAFSKTLTDAEMRARLIVWHGSTTRAANRSRSPTTADSPTAR